MSNIFWRVLIGVLAGALTVYAVALLGAGIADTAYALLGAVVIGIAAIVGWRFALGGLLQVQRILAGMFGAACTAYALASLWSGFTHRSAGILLLGAIVGVIAILCWRAAAKRVT